mgnify:CR=1 FL=1
MADPEQKENAESELAKVSEARAKLKAENDAFEAELTRAEQLRAQKLVAGKTELSPQPKPETARDYIKRTTGL